MFGLFRKKPDYFQAAFEAQQDWLEYAEHAIPVLNGTKGKSEKNHLFAGLLFSNFHFGFLISGVLKRTGAEANSEQVHAAVRKVMGEDMYWVTQQASSPSMLDSSYPSENPIEHLQAASTFMDYFRMGREEGTQDARNHRLLADAMSHSLAAA